MKKATKRIIARIMAVMMVVSILPFDMWGTANVVMAEELSVTDGDSSESAGENVAVEGDDVDTGNGEEDSAALVDGTENSGDAEEAENAEEPSASEEADEVASVEDVSVPEEDAVDVLAELDEVVQSTESEAVPYADDNSYKFASPLNAPAYYTIGGGLKSGAVSFTYENVTYDQALKVDKNGSISFKAPAGSELILYYYMPDTGYLKLNGTKVDNTVSETGPVTAIDTSKKVYKLQMTLSEATDNSYTIAQGSKEAQIHYINVIEPAKVDKPKAFIDGVEITKAEEEIFEDTTVTLSCNTTGAVIYYTTDGNSPDASKSEHAYTDGVKISTDKETTVLKAIAVGTIDGSVKTSTMLEITFKYTDLTSKVATPTATIGGVKVNEDEKVEKGAIIELSTETDNATIYYTTDKSDPTDADNANRKVYKEDEDIVIKEGTDGNIGTDNKVTIRAYACAKKADGITDMTPSDEKTFVYTVQALGAIKSADAGAVKRNTKIALTPDVVDGTDIYYTTDGSEPDTEDTTQQYTEEIVIKEDTTIKAIAVNDKYVSSPLLEKKYTIKPSQTTRTGAVHDFTIHGLKSDGYFTFDSSLEVKDEDTAISYNDNNLTGYVELGTDTVQFTPTKDGELILVTDAKDTGISVKADGVAIENCTGDESGIVTVELTAGKKYSISQGSVTPANKLYYMSVVYEYGYDSSTYVESKTTTWTFNSTFFSNNGISKSGATISDSVSNHVKDENGEFIKDEDGKLIPCNTITVEKSTDVKYKNDSNITSLSLANGGQIALPLQTDPEAVAIIVELTGVNNDAVRRIVIGEGDYADTVYQSSSNGTPYFDTTSKKYTSDPYYLKADGVFKDNKLLITGLGDGGKENKIASITLIEYKDESLLPTALHSPIIKPNTSSIDIADSSAAITLELAEADKEIEDVDIYYTTDGNDPNKEDVDKEDAETNTKKYSTPIKVSDLLAADPTLTSITIKAYASKEGNYTDSKPVTATYAIYNSASQVGTPEISITPDANTNGEIVIGATVTLSIPGKEETDNFLIYYTTDANQELNDEVLADLSTNSKIKEYSEPFTITAEMIDTAENANKVTIKVIAVDSAGTNPKKSSTNTKTYTVPSLKKPIASIANGAEVVRGDEVVLSYPGETAETAEEDKVGIYYTTDGKDPVTNGTLYTAPIIIKNDTTTIKAVAKHSKYVNSAILEVSYTIKSSTSNEAGAVHNFTTDGTKSSGYFTFAPGLTVDDSTTAIEYKGLDLKGYVELGTDTVKFTTGDKAAKLTLVVDGASVSVKAGSGEAQSYTSENNIVTVDLAAGTEYTISQASGVSAKLYYVDVKNDRAGGEFVAEANNVDPYFDIKGDVTDSTKKVYKYKGTTNKESTGRIKLTEDGSEGIVRRITFTVNEECTANIEVYAMSTSGSVNSTFNLYKLNSETPLATITGYATKSDDKGDKWGTDANPVNNPIEVNGLKGGETYYLATSSEQGTAVLYVRVKENKIVAPEFSTEPSLTSDGKEGTLYPGDTLTLNYELNLSAGDKDTSEIKWYRVKDGTATEIKDTEGNAYKEKTYKVTEADEGYTIKVVVIPNSENGKAGEEKEATFEVAVTAKPLELGFEEKPEFTSTANPDTPFVGDTLTVTYKKAADEKRTPVIEWYTVSDDNDNGTEIVANKDKESYTIVSDDKGKKIKVVVTFEAVEATETATALEAVTESVTTEAAVTDFTFGFKTSPKLTSDNEDATTVLNPGNVLTLSYELNLEGTDASDIKWERVKAGADPEDITADTESGKTKYTVTAEDIGSKIKVTVTPKLTGDEAGNDHTGDPKTAESVEVTKVVIPPVEFKTVPSLSISEGGSLTAPHPADVLTVNYELKLEAGDTDKSVIAWYRKDAADADAQPTAITGATSKTYTIQSEDIGCIISVKVTPDSNDKEPGEAKEAALSVKVTEKPAETVGFSKEPALTSSNEDATVLHPEDVLTLDYALDSEVGTDASDIKWERVTVGENGAETKADLTADTGSNNKKYTVQSEDAGSIIRVTVTPKLTIGEGENAQTLTGDAKKAETIVVTEEVLEPVTFKTAPTLTISAGGSLETPHPTDILTVNYELDIAEDDEDASTFEWYRVSATAANAEPTLITGETGKTYTIKVADVGYIISVKVTPDSKNKGKGETKEAAMSAAVTKKNTNLDSSKATIWVVGDSTVCGFNDNYYIPRQGYGEQIKNYFNADVYNLALSGASSKDFLGKSEYKTLMNGAEDAEGNVTIPMLGDSQTQDNFLIIGFGHNDEKTEDARYTNPNGDYTTEGSFAKSLYDNYIKPALDAGVTPVVVTPIVRYAEANTVESYTNTAKAHVTSTVGNYPGGDYPKAIRDMCKTLENQGVILVDLTQATIEKNVAMGDQAQYMHAFTAAKWADEATKTEKVPVGRDDTHTNSFGAKMNAWLIAELTKGTALNAYRKEGITEPTYDVDFWDPENINENYVILDYSSPSDEAVIGAEWPVYTDATGRKWYGTAFGDTGGQTKITANDDGTGGIVKTYINAEIGDDNSLTLSATGNTGKFSSDRDGFIFYYTKVKAGSNFTLSAKAKINSFGNHNQISYGLMARDELYINKYIAATMGDFVAAGPLNMTADQGKNCFGRKSGKRITGPDASKGYFKEGDILDLKIIGTSEGFSMTYGENEPVSAGFDYPLTAIDPGYIYVGVYAARDLNVTFTDISLVTDGAVYPGENPGPGPDDPQLAMPEATVTPAPAADGKIEKNATITLTAENEAAIYYTTDKTDPTVVPEKLYASPIVVNDSMIDKTDNTVTIKAIAVKDGFKNSDVKTVTYTVKTETTPIVTPDEEGLHVTFINGTHYDYTGGKITPAIEVTNVVNGVPHTLTEGVDYTVKFANNVKATPGDTEEAREQVEDKKKAKVTVTGKGNLTGKKDGYFVIDPVDISEEAGVVEAGSLVIAENAKAVPVLVHGGYKLGTKDFDIITADGFDKDKNHKWTTAESGSQIRVQGKGNYTGTRDITVTVKAKSELKSFKVTVKTPKMDYTGAPLFPAIEVTDKKDKSVILEENVHYMVVKPDEKTCTNAGKVSFSVIGMGDYSGSVTGKYTINPDKSGANITITESIDPVGYPFVSTGVTIDDAFAITYAVKDADGTVIDTKDMEIGTDYKISYSNNKKVGTAKYSISFIGSYKGTKGVDKMTGTFNIIKSALNNDSIETSDIKAVAADKIYAKPGVYKSAPVVTADGALVKPAEYTVTYHHKNEDGTLGDEIDKKNAPLTFEGVADDVQYQTVIVKIVAKDKNYTSAAAEDAENAENYLTTEFKVWRQATETQYDLTKAKVTIVDDSKNKLKNVEYTGKETSPKVKVEVKSGKSFVDVDTLFADDTEKQSFYDSIIYVNNINKGKATIVVNGDGEKFVGGKSVTYSIAARKLNALENLFRSLLGQ